MAVASLLARLGTADPVEPAADLDRLVAGFDLARFGRSPPHFEVEELWQVNAKVLHLLPYAAVAERLAQVGLGACGPEFWEAVRPNLARLSEAADWWQVCRGPLAPLIDEPAFARAAADALPPEPWTGETWKAWTQAVAAATGRKGKALFLPLRRALTARDHGPEMRNLLPLLGRERVLKRLAGETA